jgi:hypothetical protein
MTIQTPVYVSTAPDDGQGDKLRDAFIKINERFQDIASLMQNRGNWTTGTQYEPRDYILEGGEAYVCVIGHTAGTFATDLAAGKWASVDALDLRADLASTTIGKGAALVAFEGGGNVQDLKEAQGSSLVGFLQAGTGAAQRTAQDKLRENVSVKDFGAVGDGVADDTGAINLALSHLAAIGGGTLYFPQGTYKTTAEILINSGKIRLVGTGKRGVYPGLFVPGPNTPSTIMPVHSGRNAIRFFSATINAVTAFTAEGINLATLETGNMPVAAFGWELTGTGMFQRDFTFDKCGIHGFTSAFDIYGAGGMIEMGLLKVRNCNINRNTWIARTLNGNQWNGFVFRENEAGQNGYSLGQGGIAIAAHACAIEDNCMEGMRDPVKITGSYRGVRVVGNYFEANVGLACIQLDGVKGPFSVGPNTYLALDDSFLGQKVILKDCGIGFCVDPYWSHGVNKTNIPLLGADNVNGDNVLNSSVSDSITYGYLRADKAEGATFTREPQYSTIATQRVTVSEREISPQSGLPMPVQQYTTSGSGAVVLTYTISGLAAQWVVVSWLMKQQPGSNTQDPYIALNVNGSNAAGSRDYPLNQWVNYWRAGEWALITCAIRLGTSMTSLGVTLFPHGVNPPAGLVSRFLRPVVYTVDDINKAVPYIDEWIARSTVGDPTAGTWKQGDIVFNAAPTAGGQGEFLCTAAGTPGSWVYT